MKNFIYTSEINPPSAQEVVLRARMMEKQQALLRAELAAEALPEKKNRRSLLEALTAIFFIFGAPRNF